MHHYIFAGQRQSDGFSKYHWLCNSWHFLRQAQHLPMQAQCQHSSQFFNSQNQPKSTIDFIVTLGEKLGKHRGKSCLFRHHSFFFTSPWSKEHPAKLVQRDDQRNLCAQKSRCIGLEKQAENNDFLCTLLNEETRNDNNDERMTRVSMMTMVTIMGVKNDG